MLVWDPVLKVAGGNLSEQRTKAPQPLAQVHGSCVPCGHSSLKNPRRTCATLTDTRARVGEEYAVKIRTKERQFTRARVSLPHCARPDCPLCGDGGHVGRFCVNDDTTNGRTWSAMVLVSRFSFWILCGQQLSVVRTLHVEPDLVA